MVDGVRLEILRCTKCNLEKQSDQFYIRKKSSTDHKAGDHVSWCKQCCKAAAINSYLKIKEHIKKFNLKWPRSEKKKIGHRRRRFKKLYGITIEDRDLMFVSQGGCCAICRPKERGTVGQKRLHVDHDHVSGKVRGLLCMTCNLALGVFEKNKSEVLKYLERGSI